MIPSLSIIIPAYNEEANVTHTAREAEATLRDAVGQLEWILVDDGSTDRTWREITSLSHSMESTLALQHPTNRGLGAAVWTGMMRASSAWCTWLPADGQIPPQAIPGMLRLANDADLVVLMRDSDGSPMARQILSRGMYALLRATLGFDLFGYCGLYLARREMLRDTPLYSASSVQNFAVVLHARQNGYLVRQTRTLIRPRLSGQSKVTNLRTAARTFYDIMRLWAKGLFKERARLR